MTKRVGEGGKGNGDGDEGGGRQRGNGDGGKSDGNKDNGGGRAMGMAMKRVMVMVMATRVGEGGGRQNGHWRRRTTARAIATVTRLEGKQQHPGQWGGQR